MPEGGVVSQADQVRPTSYATIARRARDLSTRDCWMVRRFLAVGVPAEDLDVALTEIADCFADANDMHREAAPN